MATINGVNSTNYRTVAYETATGLNALVGNRTLSETAYGNRLAALLIRVTEIAKVIPTSLEAILSLSLIPQISLEETTIIQINETLRVIASNLFKISEESESTSESEPDLTSDSTMSETDTGSIIN